MTFSEQSVSAVSSLRKPLIPVVTSLTLIRYLGLAALALFFRDVEETLPDFLAATLRTPWLWDGRLIEILLVALMDWLFGSPLCLGIAAFWYDTADGESPDLAVCFSAYRRHRWRLALRWRLTMWLLLSGMALLCLIPSVVLYGLVGLLTAHGMDALSIFLCRTAAGLLLMVGAATWCLLATRYAAVVFLIPASGRVLHSLRRSGRILHGHRAALLSLYLRWLPGFFLCLFGLPALFILPRFRISLAQKMHQWHCA